LKQLYETDRANNYILIAQAYYAAMDEDWEAALDFSRQFLALPGRVDDGKLGMGLFEPEILNMQGETDHARASLEAFRQRIADPWYLTLSDCLLNPEHRTEITAKAGENPVHLLTGHTALGLWAEGSGDVPGAIGHYREALTSYVDYRIEYDFALGRLKQLRQTVK
jgi:hypothetical protein